MVKNSVRLLLLTALLVGPGLALGSALRTVDADTIRSSDTTKTYSLPAGSDTLMGVTSLQSVTGKVLSGANNTFSQLPVGTQMLRPIITPYPNGSTTAFTLSIAPPAATAVSVFLDGLLQYSGAGLDYTISGSTITFTTAPDAGQVLSVVYSQY